MSLRANGLAEEAIDQAFDNGEILRTHILNPTWHFVHRDDLGWMVALSGPRVDGANGHYYRKMELDAKLFRRSRAALSARSRAAGRSRALSLRKCSIARGSRPSASGYRFS